MRRCSFWKARSSGPLLIEHLLEELVFLVHVPLHLRSTMATAQLVEDAPVRQPQKPWTKAALLRVECAGSPPDGQENFLHEFLGGGSLQTLQGQVNTRREWRL